MSDLVEHLATRLRRLGSRHWREVLGSAGESAADLVYAQVRRCAERELALADDRPAGAPEVPTRPAYDAALADQLAVVGRDLALVLNARDDSELTSAVLVELHDFARLLRMEPRPQG